MACLGPATVTNESQTQVNECALAALARPDTGRSAIRNCIRSPCTRNSVGLARRLQFGSACCATIAYLRRRECGRCSFPRYCWRLFLSVVVWFGRTSWWWTMPTPPYKSLAAGRQTARALGFYGGDYLFRIPGDGTSRVTWPFPSTGGPGLYAVFARWSSGQNRTTAASYVITSSTGAATVRVNQRIAAQWHSLGTYTFAPNRGLGVTLSDRADGVVVADAILWVGPIGAADASIGPEAVASARDLQRSVDAGDEPWRLDPLEAARADGVGLGLAASDSFQLVSVKAGVARVRAQDGSVSYDIRVVQPARLGPTGIWAVERVSRTPAP
jgi:hypothetical protein